MFSDKPSAKAVGGTADTGTDQNSSVPAPQSGVSVKIYKPELNDGIMNAVSSAWSKSNTETHIDYAPKKTSEDTATTDPIVSADDSVNLQSQSVSEHDSDDTEYIFPDDAEYSLVIEPEAVVKTETTATEDPIPSLFEGIGRTDWSDITIDDTEKTAEYASSVTLNDGDCITPDDEIASGMLSDTDNVCADRSEDDESEDTIDVDELLDFIDDIEFSGMDPEPLRAVQYISTNGDPYNTAFNDPRTSSDEPAEFSITPAIKFERK